MTPHYETATYERQGFIANKERLLALTTSLPAETLQRVLAAQNINPYREDKKSG
jgi:hypothetical protein